MEPLWLLLPMSVLTRLSRFNLDGAAAPKTVTGQILSCNKVSDYNDFAHPDVVKPAVFKDAKVKKNTLKVKIPAKSIVVLKIK